MVGSAALNRKFEKIAIEIANISYKVYQFQTLRSGGLVIHKKGQIIKVSNYANYESAGFPVKGCRYLLNLLTVVGYLTQF
jgi:hypothetical protein